MHPDLDRHIHKYYGKYTGIVVDNKDIDKTGKIKVQIPSILESGKAVWARPCLPPGFFFIPEVDTRVWVEFEAGNLSYPIWVGVWYIGEEVPQDAQGILPTTSVIHTPGGFRLSLFDQRGEEHILITREKDDKGEKILMNFAAGQESIEISDANQNKIVLDNNGISMEDKTGNKVTLENSRITVAASGKVILNQGGAGIVTGVPSGTHPYCFITGAPILGCQTCEAGS